jgi:hypothetical protein
MWATLFAVLTAAGVCVGLVSFSINAKRAQDALNALPDRVAMLSIEPTDAPAIGQTDLTH